MLITEGSTEETETSSIAGAKPYNRLGEDLLRMFLEEINPDVTIDVAGQHIRAHKCILSSRCQYFAAILSGGWIESAGNVISLQGYAFRHKHIAFSKRLCKLRQCLQRFAHFGLILASASHHRSKLGGRTAKRSCDALAQERPLPEIY